LQNEKYKYLLFFGNIHYCTSLVFAKNAIFIFIGRAFSKKPLTLLWIVWVFAFLHEITKIQNAFP